MFQHYIITRFNLRREDWKTTKNSQEVLTDVWLKNRFDLFENFCLPSVKNQTNQNFKWLVFFDVNTPKDFKKRVLEYDFENFTPYFIDGMEAFLPSIREKILELTKTEYIITSRLDNDDCLHCEYVQNVQDNFDKQDFMAIDIIDGYGMQIGAQMKLGKMIHLYNPYISLIESIKNFETVWFRGHTYWKFENRIKRIEGKPSWLTVIHEENKSNKFRGYGAVPIEVINNFNINPERKELLESKFIDVSKWRGLNFKNIWYNFSTYYGKELKKAIGLYKLKVFFTKNQYD